MNKRSLCILAACLLALLQAPTLAVEPVTGSSNTSAIINGTNAPLGAYPWMAALISKSSTNAVLSQRQFCGGSLIAPEWVLTAAHCVDWQRTDNFQVLLGHENLDSSALTDAAALIDNSGPELIDVSDIIVDPRFDHDELTHDIALVRLAKPVSIKPVALPSATLAKSLAGTFVQVLGWGSNTGVKTPTCTVAFPQTTPANAADYSCSTLVFSKQGVVTQLQMTSLGVLSNNNCYNHYAAFLKQKGSTIPVSVIPDEPLQKGALCILGAGGTSSTCYGDSGGPAITLINQQAVVVGIASFVIDSQCNGVDGLQFYTEVAQFMDFINASLASKPELNFSQLCPQGVTPGLTVAPVVDGKARATLSWSASKGAQGYSVLYVKLPRTDDTLWRRDLSASELELSIELASASRYLVALQVKGKQCDSEVSKVIEVKVP